MKHYTFTLKLRTDAEPASGLGGELLNSLLPRDEQGRVALPATHLKGLMRENLFNLLVPLDRAKGQQLCDTLFGRAGRDNDGGAGGVLHLTAAAAPADARTLVVSRTALANGMAKDTSLRSSEALAAGTELVGTMAIDSDSAVLCQAALLALLSVSAVGGGRTRGAGGCRITVDGQPDLRPGQLLKDVLSSTDGLDVAQPAYQAGQTLDGEPVVALKLTFEAKTPLCLPQHPLAGNVITSGYVVPGTAVAGTLLTLLSRRDNAVASACFASPVFRCYPLLPVPEGDSLLPVYVSNTHKISKFKDEAAHDYIFGDTMIPDEALDETYRWQSRTHGLAMKGASGVLVVGTDKKVSLLRENDITRLYMAHGVVNGEDGRHADNLFTMESVCLRRLSGLVLLPQTAAELLLKLAGGGNGLDISLGRGKTWQGQGRLRAEKWSCYDHLEMSFPQVKSMHDRLFIVQTPIAYTSNEVNESSADIIQRVVKKAGWGEVEKSSVMTSVLFGWNRLKLGQQIGDTERTQAFRAILPGSVFLLKEPLAEMPRRLAEGLGENSYGGYGGVLPHPMFATALCQPAGNAGNGEVRDMPGAADRAAVYAGYELDRACGTRLSASQIARLMRCADRSAAAVKEFLEDQKRTRPKRIWDSWQPVYDLLMEKLAAFQAHPEHTQVMLRVWHDLRQGGEQK